MVGYTITMSDWHQTQCVTATYHPYRCVCGLCLTNASPWRYTPERRPVLLSRRTPSGYRVGVVVHASTCSHRTPPCSLADSTAEPFPVVPTAPVLPRRTPRARLAARRALRPVRSRPGAKRAASS